MKNLVYGALFGLFLSGCASSGVNQWNAEQVVQVEYARVTAVKPIKFDSQAEEAMAIGALEGALITSDGDTGDMLAGAAVGALFSGLVTTIAEGGSNGLLLTLETNDYEQYQVTTKKTKIKLNQCLEVIHGAEVSLKQVHRGYCGPQQNLSMSE